MLYNNITVIEGDFMDISEAKTFTFVTINSPYKQGLHRKFRTFASKLAERKLLQLAPDDLIRTSQKYEDVKEELKTLKLQNMIDYQKYFEGQGVLRPIHLYEFDFTKHSYNSKAIDKPLSHAESIVFKLKTLADKIGSLKVVAGKIGVIDKNATGKIECLKKVSISGPILEKENKNSVKIINNADNYIYTQQFFGKTKNSPTYETKLKTIAIEKESNVFVVDHQNKYTKEQFDYLYSQKPMRFVIKVIAGGLDMDGINQRTFGHTFTYLPLLDPNFKDIYKELGLSDKDKKFIESTID